MYPQFVDGNSMRGVPDPSRGPVRHPFMNYYGSKLPDGVHYGGGMPQMVRPPNPYTGKPDTMYPGHAGWNPMMMHQPYPMSKPPISKPEYHHFPGQVRRHVWLRNLSLSVLNTKGFSLLFNFPPYWYFYVCIICHQSPVLPYMASVF